MGRLVGRSLRRRIDRRADNRIAKPSRQEAENIERMRSVLEGYDRLAVPGVHRDFSTSRLLVMEEIQGGPIAQAPQGPERTQAARQLLESFYKQVLVEGFFHADPHPGNLMWWKDRIYFLEFGMVGTVAANFREQMMLLLMALWKEDAGFLTDVTLMMTDATDRSEPRFRGSAARLWGRRLRPAGVERASQTFEGHQRFLALRFVEADCAYGLLK